RRTSREYLGRMGRPAGFGAIYRHVLAFAEVALDRLFFVKGRFDLFRVGTNGSENLRNLREKKRGAILLGAHLGSFEAMRAKAERESVPIIVVGYFRNARMINAALDRLDESGKARARLIEASPDSVDFIFTVKEWVDRG